MLGAELVRVRHVAGRATAREIGNGSKDEGIVPMKMHLEEVCCLPDIMHDCLVAAMMAQAPTSYPDTRKGITLMQRTWWKTAGGACTRVACHSMCSS